MEEFRREVLSRLPLAEAVWTLLWHVADDATLSQLFQRHRGTGSERDVRFSLLVQLVIEALLHHQGSGRQSFQAARESQRLASTNEAVYGKLRRLPLELSEAFVRETTRRLRQVLPAEQSGDVPPALLAQCEAEPGALRLYVADRQFCDLKIPHRIAELGQAFLIRYSQKMLFSAEKERCFHDAQGWLGSLSDARRMRLRQVTLQRDGEEAIVLMTNLLDADQAPAEQLLEVYLARWTIERVFQQVTEVFHLERLVSTSPQGAIFQFALCSLLYNLIQVIRGYVAHAQTRPARSLSSEMIFRSVCDQLTACAVMLPTEPLAASVARLQTPDDVRERLRRLLAAAWSTLWIKPPGKKKKPPPNQRLLPGGHASAWKLINANKRKPLT